MLFCQLTAHSADQPAFVVDTTLDAVEVVVATVVIAAAAVVEMPETE